MTDMQPLLDREANGLVVLVCGGRDFKDRRLVNHVLDEVQKEQRIDVLLQGAAEGADRLAAIWAIERGVTVMSFPADWSIGRKAGPMRNQHMLDKGNPTHVVAFPGSRGTADMVRRAKAAGVPVFEVPWNYLDA